MYRTVRYVTTCISRACYSKYDFNPEAQENARKSPDPLSGGWGLGTRLESLGTRLECHMHTHLSILVVRLMRDTMIRWNHHTPTKWPAADYMCHCITLSRVQATLWVAKHVRAHGITGNTSFLPVKPVFCLQDMGPVASSPVLPTVSGMFDSTLQSNWRDACELIKYCI